MVMHVELQATCSALGYLEGNSYVKEPDCIETVKDLLRFIKREDETCDIRRQLGHAQIVQNDLIPLLKQYPKENNLFEIVLRLLVNLTQPAWLCFRNEVPEDKTYRNHYMEIESHLQAYKEAFADEDLFTVLTKKLGDLLQLDWEDRQEDDRILLERVLVLVRNVLHVSLNPETEKRTDDDASVHDQVLWAMHVSGMEDLLLYIASSNDERQFALHTLEIISLMFREQTPEQLAHAGSSRSMTEKERDEQELKMVREREKATKKANMMKYATRHSRFGGTYVVQNFKSISNNELIYHRSLGDVENISFDYAKKPKKKPKNRKPITASELKRRSTLSIRLFLKDFCIQFLDNCYNPLMYSVKDSLNHEKTQENDETYYLWAMRFFMEFSRIHNFRVEVISETMSVPTFHYIQTNLMNYHDMIMTDKKAAITWSKRMHLALRSYQELLLTLNEMDKSHEEQLLESSKVVKSNIFYLMEYRDIFLILLKKFDQTRQSRCFLKDLVETTHLFLKMLEHYCKKVGHVVVQKKKKKTIRKKKQSTTKNSEATKPQFTEEELENMWDNVSEELSAIFQGREEVPEGITPFDAASDTDIDAQRVDAMLRIHETLREGKGGIAVALFRAAREVWPDRGEFGTTDISPEDEFMAMREIFFSNLPSTQNAEDPTENEIVEDEMEDEVLQEEVSAVSMSEQEFELKDFIKRFGHPQVLQTYTVLLADYYKNSQYANHCVIKTMHRVAVDLKLPAMLFQTSIFRVFQKILQDPMAKSSNFKELVQFSTYIVRKFFEVASQNSKVFMELLFWKNTKECIELTDGYGAYKEYVKKGKQLWTEEQDMELTRLFEEYSDLQDDTEVDIVDRIMQHLTDSTKTRRQVIRELVHLSLIDSAAQLKKRKGPGRGSKVWREEEELELGQLFDQHKNSDDTLGNIVSRLTVQRSKQAVTKKLVEIGLVEDKKELHKKRRGNNGKQPQCISAEFIDDTDSDTDSDRPLPTENCSNDDDGNGVESNKFDRLLDSSSESDSDSDLSDNEISSSSVQTKGNVKQMAKNLIDKGLEGPVKWIQTGLTRTAEDRIQDGSTEPIPLVPLTEENEDAMENVEFLSFLKKIGISLPANEQESYWRIPSNLTAAALRRLAKLLDPNTPDAASEDNTSSSKATGRYKMLKNLAKNKRTKKKAEEKAARYKRRSLEKQGEGKSKAGKPSSSNKPSRLKKIADDSSDSDDEKLVIDEGTQSNQSTPHKKRTRTPTSSSGSESENGLSSQKSSKNTIPPTKKQKVTSLKNIESSSEDEQPLTNVSEGTSKMPANDSTRLKLSNNARKSKFIDFDISSDESESVNEKKIDDVSNDDKDDQSKMSGLDSDSDDEPLSNVKQTFPATLLSQNMMNDSDSDIEDHIPIRRAIRKQQIESDSDSE